MKSSTGVGEEPEGEDSGIAQGGSGAGASEVPVAAIFVLSGFAALVYQVAWQRALFTIYGVDVESATVVVTAFMLGLGLGSLAGANCRPARTGSTRMLRRNRGARLPAMASGRWRCLRGSVA